MVAIGVSVLADVDQHAAQSAQETIKIGLIAPFSGPFADYGKQMQNGINAYMKKNGDHVAGKKVEVIVRDTTGPAPEIAKRLAQELVVRDKVDFLAGFGFTPEALAVATGCRAGKKTDDHHECRHVDYYYQVELYRAVLDDLAANYRTDR